MFKNIRALELAYPKLYTIFGGIFSPSEGDKHYDPVSPRCRSIEQRLKKGLIKETKGKLRFE